MGTFRPTCFALPDGNPAENLHLPAPIMGCNPANFDYRFNLGYGKEYFEGNEFLRELRTILDEETAAKLHGTD